MLQTSKIKLLALALIYVLHVAFFDDVMAQGNGGHGRYTFTSSQEQSSQKKLPAESSYRLLTKHEQSKQTLVSLPDAVDFVSTTFTGFIAERVKQPLFGAFARLNVSTFKLYRLFRVFLV
jgi:hypothetical protein